VSLSRALRSDLTGMLACVAALSVVGLMMGLSVAPPGEGWARLGTHCVHLALGLAAFLAAAAVPVERARQVVPGLIVLLFVVLMAMLLVPGFGHESHAAVRWVMIGSQPLQPSVMLQCLWPAAMASWIAEDPLRCRQHSALWRLMLVFGVVATPVLLQPDFGSVVILAVATGMLFFFAGAPLGFLRQLVPVLIGALVVALLLFDHVDARLSSFLSNKLGMQAVRAQEAFAVGGLSGAGPGLGFVKMGWVPEGETDYVLALIAEEWGLLGTFAVWTLFVAFTLFGVRAARRAESRYAALLIASATLMISLQAALNMAVVTNIAPPKGLPLPFISRGGSSILALSALLGLAVRASLQAAPGRFRLEARQA